MTKIAPYDAGSRAAYAGGSEEPPASLELGGASYMAYVRGFRAARRAIEAEGRGRRRTSCATAFDRCAP